MSGCALRKCEMAHKKYNRLRRRNEGRPQSAMHFSPIAACLLVLVYCTLLPRQIEGKRFGACELAKFLVRQRGIARRDVPTWVCIATKESNRNSNARSPKNGNGSRDHGIFQINDKYWCTASGPAGKECHAKCSSFEDNNITDDVACVVKIHSQTQRARGNGFQAWSTYHYCNTNSKVSTYVRGCKY
ncbi:hypothetical protein M8J77_014796 [Diaphorina citri]|nr:hypothetical protein M8J77_014796 [Diaphorina citri]